MAYEPSTWLWLSFCFIAFSVLDQWSWWYSGMCTGRRQREGHKWHSCVVVTQPSPWMTNIAQHFRDCHAVPAAPSWPWGAGGSQPWKGPVLLNGAVSPWYRASSSSDFDAGSARLRRVDLRSDGHVPFATVRSGLGVDLLWLVPLGYWNVEAAPKQTILKSQIFALMKHGYLEGLFFFWRSHSVFLKWIWSMPSCEYHRWNRQNRRQYWRFTPDTQPWQQQQPTALHHPSATPCRVPCPRQRKYVPSSIPCLKMVDLKKSKGGLHFSGHLF